MILATSRRPDMLSRFGWCVTAFLLLFSVQAVESRQAHENGGTQSIVERIEIQGNRRVRRDTMLAHMRLRPGDRYNAEAVERDAHALRDMGYFDQVLVNVEGNPDPPNGKIVVFTVIERPIIRRIQYQGIQSITEADILRAFRENKINLSVGSWFDKAMLPRAATVIQQLLAAYGHPSATVTPTYERIVSTDAVSVLFTIEEGPKAQSRVRRSSQHIPPTARNPDSYSFTSVYSA
jgi:outer membrane protein insertion porin family